MRSLRAQKLQLTLAVCTASAAIAIASGGCSFLLDFPSEGGGGGTGSTGPGGGGTGGSGGGGGPSICAELAPAPTLDEVTWRAEMTTPGDSAQLATTGLVRDDQNGIVYAYGQTTDGLAGLFTGSDTDVLELYVTSLRDAQAPALVFGATACNFSYSGRSGRLTLTSTGQPLISGMLGFDNFNAPPSGPGSWSLALDDSSLCGLMETSVPPEQAQWFGGAPFFAVVGPTSVNVNLPGLADGVGLDIAANKIDATTTRLAAIGIAEGSQVWLDSTPDPNGRLFVQRSTETTGDETFVLDDHFAEVHFPVPYGEAGIAIDDEGNAWFGGGSCNDQVACADQGAFFGVLDTVQEPELIVERPGTRSAISTVRFTGDTVLIGGRYDGALSMLGITLPESGSMDAFVVAMDPSDREVRWTYPNASTPAGYDTQGYNTVADLAWLGTRECGAVYLLGCTVVGGGSDAACVTPAQGKRGFLVKLDLGTGQEVWREDFAMENPGFEFFLPSALTASEDAVWLAGTAFGKITIAGTQIDGAAPMETFVLKLSP